MEFMFNLNGAKARNSEANLSAQDKEAKINSIMDDIDAQKVAFEKKNPDFDMKAEIKNPDFVNFVWGKGLSVEDAYFLVHKEEIMEKAKAEAVDAYLERNNRIQENGAGKNRPAVAKKNPKDLSDKEIDAIIERAKKGEKITF